MSGYPATMQMQEIVNIVFQKLWVMGKTTDEIKKETGKL